MQVTYTRKGRVGHNLLPIARTRRIRPAGVRGRAMARPSPGPPQRPPRTPTAHVGHHTCSWLVSRPMMPRVSPENMALHRMRATTPKMRRASVEPEEPEDAVLLPVAAAEPAHAARRRRGRACVRPRIATR